MRFERDLRIDPFLRSQWRVTDKRHTIVTYDNPATRHDVG
jgi:hypothetical protein